MFTDLHITDQELLQAADGELASRRAGQVRAHLAACWSCRARMAEIEGAIADFVRAHRQATDFEVPSSDGPRALLRVRLATLAQKPKVHFWTLFAHITSTVRAAALCTAVLIATLLSELILQHSSLRREVNGFVRFESEALPERRFTPGATRSVAISEVCSMPHEEVVREVSASMRQRVLQEYGIMNARPDDYEIDFLIAPGLGGTEDIHNLWPQPSKSTKWNAYVKDALEERLHQLVCSGDLELSEAQRDIATDWIAAYKKYFHADVPLSMHSQIGIAIKSELAANEIPHRLQQHADSNPLLCHIHDMWLIEESKN